MRIIEAFDLYRSERIIFQNQSRKTEEHHQVAKKSLVTFIGSDILLKDLTFETVRAWKQDMEVRSKSPETIRGYLIKLRRVLHYIRLKEGECLNPELIPLPRRVQTIPNFIEPQEVQQLIDVQDNMRSKKVNRARNKAVIALLYSSGIRVSELCRLDIKDVRNDFFTVLGKGGVAAPSFIDGRARQHINQSLALRKDNCPALFVSDFNGKRITPGGVQEVLKNARRSAKFVERITPHTLRHSFATNLMRNGADIRYVQALMHHKNIQTTQVYLHVVDEELHSLHTKFHSY